MTDLNPDDRVAGDPTSEEIGGRAKKGARWTSLASVSIQLVRIVSGAIIADLLGPSEFGIVGLVTVVTLFVEIIKDLGFSLAVVQAEKRPSDAQLSSLFWLNVAFGLAISVGLFVLAPPLASLLNSDEIVGLLRFAGLGFLLSAPSVVHTGLLRRELRFEALTYIRYLQLIGLVVVPVVLAAMGFGAWSIVWGANVTAVMTGVALMVANPWRPSFRFSMGDVAPFLGFGGTVSVTRVVNYFSQNGDRILVGSWLGTVALGYYNLGFRLVLMPVRLFGIVAVEVLMPAMSRFQSNTARMGRVYLRTIGLVSVTSIAAMMFIAANAEALIDLVFDEVWLPASDTVTILAFAGCFQGIIGVTPPVLMALGRTRLLLASAVSLCAVSVTAYTIGAQFDVESVAVSFLIALAVMSIPYVAIPARLLGVRPMQLLAALAPSVLLGAAVYGSITAARLFLVDSSGVWARALIPSALGAVAFLVLAIAWRPPAVADMIEVLPLPPQLRKALTR